MFFDYLINLKFVHNKVDFNYDDNVIFWLENIILFRKIFPNNQYYGFIY